MVRFHTLAALVLLNNTHSIGADPVAPPASEVQDALIKAGAGIGNSASSAGLGFLAQSTKDTSNALSLGLGALLKGVATLLNPELKYSYGQSPPVYPSPVGSGDGEWAAAYEKAKAAVARMTDEEKNNITFGVSNARGCNGFSGSAPAVDFPGICLQDAESGVRGGKLVNGYAAQLSIGASWNKTLAHEKAVHLGREFKKKGVNVVNGPVIGPLGALATGGRNWEGFTNDPYLSGELVGPTVEGLQQSVVASVKHMILNEQETHRMPFLAGYVPELIFTQAVSANIDDETIHSTYLWPFYDAVKAGAGSVMCSYNRVNNSYACQNSKVLNGLLKTELGFRGFVLSDWNAQHTGIASANAGLDLVMPFSQFWNNNQLVTSVKNGSMTSTRLDDMATRILASWYRYAPLSDPGMDNKVQVDARDPAAESALLQGAVEGHVLVKNVNNALPLKKPSVISIFGYDAPGGLNTSDVDATKYSFGLTNTPNYTDGRPFSGIETLLYMAEVYGDGHSGPPVALGGTLNTGGGSGATTPTAAVSPYDALLLQAKRDNTRVYADIYSQKPRVNPASDACLVFVNAQSSESWDRSTLADSYSDTLIKNVASQCRNTIVTIHNAGIRLVDAWIDHPNITAVLYAHVPGQASGTALTEILYGRQSPSGRLPYTVAKAEKDYGPWLHPTGLTAKDSQFPQADFTKGDVIDYKYFIQQGIQPRFAFGYGLTYTTFAYANLSVSRDASADTSRLPPGSPANPSTPAPEGGVSSLYDTIATVTATVTNTGSVAAAEVAQLYVGIPNGLPRVLRGFDKKLIRPGESASVTFVLRRRDLSKWDTVQQAWVLQQGQYALSVGKSVEDLVLKGNLVL